MEGTGHAKPLEQDVSPCKCGCQALELVVDTFSWDDGDTDGFWIRCKSCGYEASPALTIEEAIKYWEGYVSA